VKHKAFKRHRRRIRRCFDEWGTKLGLRWWSVEIRYYDRPKHFRKASGASANAAMRVWADWRYMTATIAVNVPALAELSDDELERSIVHELVHILVNEMREDDPDVKHEERTVTMLTKAVIWVRDLSRKGKGE